MPQTLAPELSAEQRKRLDLVEAYERDTGADRTAWNAAIAGHEKLFDEKWQTLQSEIELKRAQTIERLRGEGRDEQQIGSMAAAEVAAAVERHWVEKDSAARKIEVASPKSWADWLAGEKALHPEDPVYDALLEEARRAPDASLEGFLRTPSPNAVVSELMPRPAGDGKVEYTRGALVAVVDTGARLDVRRSDDRSIEAALKIAAQKFDEEKGLMLTGDLAFKRRAAEIAGRLGLRLQNIEPEVVRAYQHGKLQAPHLDLDRAPSVVNGIEGDALEKAVAVLKGPMILRADPRTIEALRAKTMPEVEVGDGTVTMPGERVWQSRAAVQRMPMAVLPLLAEIDVSKDDGGLTKEQLDLLQREGTGMVQDGKLTQQAIDIALVRDDRVMRTRETLSKEEAQELGFAYRTAGEREHEQRVEDRTGKTPKEIEKEKQAQEREKAAEEKEQKREREEERGFAFDQATPKPKHRREKALDLELDV